MNRILLMLILFTMLLLSACGQYGDLYAPPAESEQTAEQSPPTEVQQEQQDQAK